MTVTVVEKHQQIIQSFHDAYVQEMVATAREELNREVLDLRKGNRWYQTSVDTQIEEIWDTIRNSERLLDYVMEGTSALQLHGLDNDAENKRLIDKIAYSWAWSNRYCSTDRQLSERAPTIEFAKRQLENNCWVMFVYLLQYIQQTK